MTKTSHKKNRPFDFKLIELVEPHPVLYQRHWAGLSTYECMKEKTRVWSEIAKEMNSDVDFCISRWNNLRGHFQRELRNCRELCPKQGIIRGSTWPYLEAMKFLESTVMFNKPPKPQRLSKREEKRRQMLELKDEQDSNDCDEYVTESEESTAEFLNETLEVEDFSTVTEVLEEIPPVENVEQPHDNAVCIETNTTTNLQRMSTLLDGIEGENRARAERRILAYLCKCQLRALNNEGVADLTI